MAGKVTDPKRQLLTLIRDFASEKSQGERRVSGLKKRIEELRLELEAANAEREESKRLKETTEQELKGYEVELALNDTAFQALEARISLIQGDISTVGSEVDTLKREEGALRDGFISQMYELNAKIRAFQKTAACSFQKESSFGTVAEVDHNVFKKEDAEVASKALEGKLADIVSPTTKEEERYLEQENIQKQSQPELTDLERKVSLMEVIGTETKALQELKRDREKEACSYLNSKCLKKFLDLSPHQLKRLIQQTSELEQTCASLSEKLQKRCICPNCGKENVEALGGILDTFQIRQTDHQ